jgi:hypothetical protein
MTDVLHENVGYRVELDEDTSNFHSPHMSWGTYRVFEMGKTKQVYQSTNRDKALGVYEYLSRLAHIRNF